MNEVISAWGAPAEKTEQESHRREIWRYPKGASVVFREGKLVSWTHRADVLARRAELEAEQVEPPPVSSLGNPDTRDLVREIAKEVPSGPDVPYSEPPADAHGSGNPTGFVPNIVPQVQPAPGLVPGNQILQPDED